MANCGGLGRRPTKGQARTIARRPPLTTAYIHGPAGFSSRIEAIFDQWSSSRLRLSTVDWLVVPVRTRPRTRCSTHIRLSTGLVANALITGDDNETLGADDFQPLVVHGLPGHFREIRMAGEYHVAVQLGQGLAEGQVVLVDEERGRHRRLCGQ